MAEERREQILDAMVRCIRLYGLAGATRSRVAAEAGVTPSAILHFVGTREQVTQAAIKRGVAQLVARLEDFPKDADAREQLDFVLAEMFDGHLVDDDLNQLVDELFAYGYRDETTRVLLRELYRMMRAKLEQKLAEVHPHASEEQRADTAHAVLAIAHASETFARYDIDRTALARARRVVAALMSSLESGSAE